MKFTLITLVAALSASAVHGHANHTSLQPDLHNTTSGNGSMIGHPTNATSANGTHGDSNPNHMLNNTSLPPSTVGNGSMDNSTGTPMPATNGTGSGNSTMPPASPEPGHFPAIPPLPINATIDQKIARLEAKIADHKHKLEHAEAKLSMEKQKLAKVGDGKKTDGTNSTSDVPGSTTNLTSPNGPAANSSGMITMPLQV